MRLWLLFLTVLSALLLLGQHPERTAAVTLPPFGDGSDGPRTYGASTVDAPIDSAALGAFGSTSLSATNPLFAAGQRIMIHQSQGSGAGAWETNEIQAYSPGTITTVNPLANDYGGQSQVLILPEYTDLTINSGVTVTAKAWDGSTGGIFAFLATGIVTVSGTVDASGKGFRGATIKPGGRAGEGTTTTYNCWGCTGFSPTGSGGMGGHDVQHGSAGGGGNGTSGSDGSYEPGFWGSQGLGGLAVGSSDLSVMLFGGGGGNTDVVDGNSFGGNGGGIIALFGANVNVGVSATITSGGTAGITDNAGGATGGGGGAGGSVLVRSQTASLGVGRVLAPAGSGGAGSNAGPGGAGGVGRIAAEGSTSVSGCTSPPANPNTGTRCYTIDEVDAPTDSTASGAAGSTSLSGTNPLFSAGQKILIHQSRGGGAGPWELNEVASYSSGVITTVNPLANSYGGSAQVLVVPEYMHVIVSPGVTVTAKPWNGQVGGVLAFIAYGTVTIDGAISASGTGYRGAPLGIRRQGEGTEGLGVHSPLPNGNGGGSGQDVQNGSAGGGGNGTAGGDGGYNPGHAGAQGLGGNTAGAVDLSAMVFGGGGGNTEECCVKYSMGGTGGGIVLISTGTITISPSGSISSNGTSGTQNGDTKTGGGGGAGGSIFLKAGAATIGINRVTATGGPGGVGLDSSGGAGGTGRIRIEYCDAVTGITSPAASQFLLDRDLDSIGDCVDLCPDDPSNDTDSDNYCVGTGFNTPKSGGNDNCPATANTSQSDNDGDGQAHPGVEPTLGGPFGNAFGGDACDGDDDNDLVGDVDEPPCGGDPLDTTPPLLRPERIDGAFAAADDDGDTQIDEALPAGAEAYDCDGDGYVGTAEAHLFTATNVRDQDPCGTDAWPSDFVAGGVPDSTNRVNVLDVISFIAPVRHLNTSPPEAEYADRWDLIPGAGIFPKVINVTDLTALIAGSSGYPPMLGGVRAFNHATGCPWPP